MEKLYEGKGNIITMVYVVVAVAVSVAKVYLFTLLRILRCVIVIS